MGETTIQWANYTFNPWIGCQRVSPGCVNCYAEAYDKRVGGVPKSQRMDPNVRESRWGPKGRRVRTSASNWREPLKWDAAAKAAGERHRVFCSSLADVFEDRPELVAWRAELFDLIARTPNLDWLLLTKRPTNIKRLWPVVTFPDGSTCYRPGSDWWPNVWLGTTVEDQQRAEERIPALLDVSAAVHFLSCEPLLEPVNLRVKGASLDFPRELTSNLNLDWVIIGGESGAHARSFHTEWARDLIDQCRSLGVAPFVKQLGSNAVAAGRDQLALLNMKDRAGGDPSEWPEDLRVREFPR